jgi:Putative prokaryotic signal transducing protein
MKTDKGVEPVEVFAGTAVQATLVKSLLENAEIDAYLKDEFTGVLYPWHSSPGGVGAVKVLVSSVDQVKARIVVDEYENNLKKK